MPSSPPAAVKHQLPATPTAPLPKRLLAAQSPLALPPNASSDLVPFPTRPNKTTVLFALAAQWDAPGCHGLTVLTITTRMTVARECHTLPLALGGNDALRVGPTDVIPS